MALTDSGSPEAPKNTPRSPLAAVLPYTTALLLVAAAYVAWTFYSRHEESQKAQQALEQKQDEHRKNVVKQIYGNGEVSFTAFGVDNGLLKKGESTQLCYGVVNAKNVKIEPPVEQAKPSYHHCLEISPKTTTTYTITADDGAGNSKTQSLVVRVQ